MSIVLQKELTKLKEMILDIGKHVEDTFKASMSCLENKDKDGAQVVLESDQIINRKEIEIEEECLKILALHQPVANDLRFIVAALKMNNDLERIADIAGSIARRTIRLIEIDYDTVPEEITVVSKHIKSMLRKSLLAFLEQDTLIARSIIETEDLINKLNREAYKIFVAKHPADLIELERSFLFLSIGKRLERIGDLTTNLAEDLVYIVDGEIIRHSKLKF